jgi:dihydrofolate reductase
MAPMGKLIYALNVSADGFVETPDHGLEWSIVNDEILHWFSGHERALQASLYGTRLYELMNAYWPTAHRDPNATPAEREYAEVWQAQPKIVFSHSLDRVEGNSRLVHGDPADVAGALARLREEFDGDLGVGGATLAASFIRAGLVDEFRLVVHPVVIGAGTPFFPPLAAPLALTLVETQRLASGLVYLRYVRG